ncbi:hypothetical protein PLESTM_001662800 [Pleodorina starrii]|nr:hypothetical protein PLESTM_001662800 [Pleodorina starrii]
MSRAAAANLCRFTSVTLSQPSPTHAFAWRWAAPGALRGLTFRHRLHLLCLTAASGSLTNLELASEACGCILRVEALEAAAAAAQLPACEWMHLHGWSWGDALASAARAGHRQVCAWLLERGCPWDECALPAAAAGGHPELVEWLLSERPRRCLRELDVAGVLTAAAEGCDLLALRQLQGRLLAAAEPLPPPPLGAGAAPAAPPPPPPRLTPRQVCLMIAAAAGSPTTDWRAKLEWLETQPGGAGPGVSGGGAAAAAACTKAAACSDAPERLVWLRQRGYPLYAPAAAAAAAQAGNVPSLEYILVESGGGFLVPHLWKQAARAAAKAGHLAVLQALHAAGCLSYPGDDLLLIYAAAGGGAALPMVAWLVGLLGGGGAATAAAPPDDDEGRVLNAAARSGCVEMLSWLRDQGFSWSRATLASAAAGGCEEAMEWLVARGCPMPANGRPYLTAACNSDLSTLRCLRRLGCPWGTDTAAFSHCIAKGFPLAALRWLASEAGGCPVDWDDAAAAVERFFWRPESYRRQLMEWLAGAGARAGARPELEDAEAEEVATGEGEAEAGPVGMSVEAEGEAAEAELEAAAGQVEVRAMALAEAAVEGGDTGGGDA